MESFLEILKFTIPGLVVFATAYFLLKQILDDKYRAFLTNQKNQSQKIILPLRMQAYERFALLCDRLEIPSLILRIRMPEMTVRQLQLALMVSIQQEFDHNVPQQIYLSNTLWQIISVAKEQTMSMVSRAGEGLEPDASCQDLIDKLMEIYESLSGDTPMRKAAFAIRSEAASHF